VIVKPKSQTEDSRLDNGANQENEGNERNEDEDKPLEPEINFNTNKN